MKKNAAKSILIIACLILVTGITTASHSAAFSQNPVLTVDGHLVQNRILQNSRGIVDFDLTLKARHVATDSVRCKTQNVDMVIVLDRSGSMNGRKINNARRSIIALLGELSAGDRFSLVTYAMAYSSTPA